MAGSDLKRILFVHSLYQNRGGEERALEIQAEALSSLNIKNKILYRNFEGPLTDRNIDWNNKIQLARNIFLIGPAAKELRQELNQFDPDVIHFHNLMPHWGYGSLQVALNWALRKGKKVVSTIHNQRWVCSNGLFFREKAPCYECFEKKNPMLGALKNCRNNFQESLIYSSAISMAWMKQLYNHPSHFLLALNGITEDRLRYSFPEAQVHLLPNPVVGDIEKPKEFKINEEKKWLGKRYGVIGRLSPEKGIDRLLKELKWGDTTIKSQDHVLYDPSVQFVFAGEGPLKTQILTEEKINPRVKFLGLLNENEVFSLLESLDGYFFSSIVEEQCPTVLRLAQKMNKPIYSWTGKMKKESLDRWGPLFTKLEWAEKYLELLF